MMPSSAVKPSSNGYRRAYAKYERPIALAKKGPVAATIAVRFEAAHSEVANTRSAERVQKNEE